MVEPRQTDEPGFAQQRQVDREGKRAQPGIGADVARRLLAADMLLTGGEGQYPAAPPLGIDGLADETARHLPHELLARGKQPDMRSAEVQRVAERLSLGRDDVGAHLAGWPDRA